MLTRKPMRRTSRNTGPSSDVVDAVLERACYCCEVCGTPCADQRGTDWSLHHRRPRGMGGTRWSGINLPSNLLLVCGSGTTLCHGVIENYRAGAVAAGWLVLSRTDPATVAVLITRDRWCYLTDDGEYADAPAPVSLRDLQQTQAESLRRLRGEAS